ncbi:MAG: aldo/keto reductase [Prevotella sp.]|nr:aldo/keto reductase [Prevotella sp.]
MKEMEKNNISRRSFLKVLGAGAVTTAAVLTGCKDKKKEQAMEEYKKQVEPQKGKMTYRTNPTTGDQVSLLGYGMMRLPTHKDTGSSGSENDIDQEMVNRLVDYAIEHGVNYFDTSPAYCQGLSEHSTGIALHRHDRKKFFVATKLSNFSDETWSREESIKMYHNSFRELQVDYIDYYLLHGIGMGGMEALNGRYIDNGILDFLVGEREKGHIRNLGFFYHGEIEVFDYLLSLHDKYKWDFVQIELNYLDWEWADEINDRNTDARYLYGELEKRGIPAVIMEPLLGGRLSNLPQYLVREMKQRAPERSVASWAFRYAGSPKGVLTVLSGMTYMEHLKDNLLSYCPLTPVTEEETAFLYHVAEEVVGVETIPCNDCKYCMPCPYGVDIPGIFVHYNKVKNAGRLPRHTQDEHYEEYRREYLIGLDRSVPRLRQASHCIQCGQCEPHCPQNIRIPRELAKIDEFVERMKQRKDEEE